MAATRPNLLLITTDQQRYDALGINGNEVLRTPNLDALAAGGVNFSRAYTTCPSCIAARRTILTGQAAHTHGLPGYQDGLEFNPAFTLPGLLGDAGYQTQLIGKLHMFPQRKRFGFDNLILSEQPDYRPDSPYFSHNDYADWLKARGVRAEPGAHGIGPNGRVARPFHLPEDCHQTNFLVEQAIEFLTRRRDPACPYFLHLSFWAPHPPLIPPQIYYDRYARRGDLEPSIGSWVPSFDRAPAGLKPDSPTGPFRLEEIQDAMAGYYGLINHLDDQIAHLFERVFTRGGRTSQEPLWTIFASDHGEMLGDHQLFRKTLGYEGSAHVPFFVSGRNVDFDQGESDQLVCLEDLLPTFCDLGGARIPKGVDGKSLAPILRGERRAIREDLHGEHSGPFANHFLVHGRYKYIWYAHTNKEQLFDLEDDPHELADISGHAELLEPLRKRMAKHLQGRKDYKYDMRKVKPLFNGAPEAFWKK